MNVFDLRSSILKDYQQFTRSFTRIRAEDISASVDGEYAGSRFWPEPLLQLNPRYEPAAPMPDMVADGTLHPGCLKVFAMGPKSARVPLRLHAHQGTAAVLGAAGAGDYGGEPGGGSAGGAWGVSGVASEREVCEGHGPRCRSPFWLAGC